MIDDLYSARILGLAANLPHAGRLVSPDGTGERVARLCGSRAVVDVVLNDEGRIAHFAQDIKACALGQAATSVLAEHIAGAPVKDVFAARDALRAMLKDGAEPPTGRFAELRHLAGVADYPPRHTSTMLAFEAACEAIEQVRTKRAAAA